MPLTVLFLSKGTDKETITDQINETATETGNIKMIT
jgi:hypothetical protein